MNPEFTIGFLGAGQMALALATGFSKHIDPKRLFAYSPTGNSFNSWRSLGANVSTDPASLKGCLVIIIAVKPHMYQDAIRSLTWDLSSHIFVSVMAGLSIDQIKSTAGLSRVVRIMTNTASSVGCACSVYSLDQNIKPEDEAIVRSLLESVGSCEKVSEFNINAFTGLGGSGPAFIYTIIEALADGGVLAGLPRLTARKFAAQMTMGAAKVALESGQHTGQLKDAVTSPAGTTMSGVQVLERGGIRGILIDAVQASANRAAELSGTAKK